MSSVDSLILLIIIFFSHFNADLSLSLCFCLSSVLISLRRFMFIDICVGIYLQLGELDFRSEATRLTVFRAFLDREGLSDVATCPLPVERLCSEKVLTMTRLKGKPLLEAAASEAASAGAADSAAATTDSAAAAIAAAAVAAGGRSAPSTSATSVSSASSTDMSSSSSSSASDVASASESALVAALNVWCLSVTRCQFFHADMHAGNLLLLDDDNVGDNDDVEDGDGYDDNNDASNDDKEGGKRKGGDGGKVGFLDFGIGKRNV
jgi:hypothetical protein